MIRGAAPLERETYSLPVDPEMDSALIEILKSRGDIQGNFADESVFVPETGRTKIESISAVCRATGSLLEYSDGILTYTEGKLGAKGDEHATIFMRVTIDNSKQK